jgi:hypothetical protein
MIVAFSLLVSLIALSPLFLLADTPIVHGIVAAYTAATIIIVAWSIRPGEADHLSKLVSRISILAATPAVWILIQVLPLPIAGLQHPIWTSAQAALEQPIIGSISISPGATLVSLGRYLSAYGIFFIATAVTIDRRRAEVILLLATTLSVLIAAVLFVHNLGGYFFLGEISSTGPRAAIAAATLLGTVLTMATMSYALERYETRRSKADFTRSVLIIAASLFGAIVCWLSVVLFMPNAAIFAAGCGVGTFILIFGFRRLGLGPRTGLTIAAIAVAVAISIVAGSAIVDKSNLALRYSVDTPKILAAITQRIIADTGWLGSGAGSFTALLPIYQNTADLFIASKAPTTASGLLIEFGLPALCLIFIMAMAVIAWLLQGAFRRGRDSFFSAASASCAVVLLIETFFDASISESGVMVIAATLLGLGLSQSVSRTSR